MAWLYYVANHTQQQIAEELNVSRPTVQRLVAAATESGYVQVRINHPTSECMEVARRLKDRFGLKVCEVAPIEPNGDARSLRAIAVIGATLAERYLSRNNLEVLAFGSGRTLKAVVDEIAEFRLPNLKILSLAAPSRWMDRSKPLRLWPAHGRQDRGQTFHAARAGRRRDAGR